MSRRPDREGMIPLVGVIPIIYGIFSLLLTLFSTITPVESLYARTERLGVEVPGRIESIQKQSGNEYDVIVSFTSIAGRHYSQRMSITDGQENLTVPSDVTVIYLPESPTDAFIKKPSTFLGDRGGLATKILHSFLYIGGGALFVYIFGGGLSSYGRSESVDTR